MRDLNACYEAGLLTNRAVRMINILNSPEALVTMPYTHFEEYVPDPERMYYRGFPIRVGCNKYMPTGEGRVELDKPPPVNPLFWLFRDINGYDPDGTPRIWISKEFCLKGSVRYEENVNQPEKSGWYVVTAPNAGDNNTPPSGMPQVWKKVDG